MWKLGSTRIARERRVRIAQQTHLSKRALGKLSTRLRRVESLTSEIVEELKPIAPQGVTASQPRKLSGLPKFATANPSCGGPSFLVNASALQRITGALAR